MTLKRPQTATMVQHRQTNHTSDSMFELVFSLNEMYRKEA